MKGIRFFFFSPLCGAKTTLSGGGARFFSAASAGSRRLPGRRRRLLEVSSIGAGRLLLPGMAREGFEKRRALGPEGNRRSLLRIAGEVRSRGEAGKGGGDGSAAAQHSSAQLLTFVEEES
ncbi:hypothetical protein MRX96_056083 [Rhipicephalus microplus]